ncbi:MAG: hydantoinase/oxoprolinase N-terminal domain-containing protein, partial [Gemmatimonadota bacterium]
MPDATGRWRVWIDTGGTFTDCLGVDPAGRLHRLKVLSSSSLRGRVADRVDGRTLSVDEDWLPPLLRDGAAGRELLAGCGFRLLEGQGGEARVEGFDPGARR